VAIIFLVLALFGIMLRKTYFALPLKELKRRAVKEPDASQLYRAAAYGDSLRVLLWLYIGFTSAVSFVVLARSLPIWASLLIVGPIIWIAFSFLPATRVTKLGIRLTKLTTPFIAYILNYFHPALSRGNDVVAKRYRSGQHTGLYERQDLLELLDKQLGQQDSRFSEEELSITKNALAFSDYKVADVLTPMDKIKTVLAGETIGPILIDEIHKSGQEYVLVSDKKGGEIVGSLPVNKLGISSRGKVSDLMDANVYFVNSEDSLADALHAFFATNRALFVVVDDNANHVGIISVATIVRQLLGHIPGDEFEKYSDPDLVASRHKTLTPANNEPNDSVKTDEEVIE